MRNVPIKPVYITASARKSRGGIVKKPRQTITVEQPCRQRRRQHAENAGDQQGREIDPADGEFFGYEVHDNLPNT